MRLSVAPDGDESRYRLAASLSGYGSNLAEAGRPAEGAAVVREAVDLYRDVAATHPDTYGSSLAGGLNSMSICLSEMGEHRKALAAAKEALNLGLGLASAHPDAFEPNLANYWNNLCNRFLAVGQAANGAAAAHSASRFTASWRPPVRMTIVRSSRGACAISPTSASI
jgi:tetratricopeptide (TPR) repeat protein